ncbi:auxilin-related protein 2-like isoform X2 [Tasmannia lanceolata]|uniref:auxilin-related protein 2-like isoform X2 n=1 Tax=Tasmannia lanceolata TaxID=3420 RepID=UPI004064C75B
MDDFPGLLAKDFGFRPQGKSIPMSASKGGPNANPRSSIGGKSAQNSTLGNSNSQDGSSFAFDSMFKVSNDGGKFSSLPVYDKPSYDDDIFDGVSGLKSSNAVKYEDIFASVSSPPNHTSSYGDFLGNLGRTQTKGSSGKLARDGFDDLIPGFGGITPPQSRETSEINQPQRSTKPTSSILDDPFVILESTSVPSYSSSGLFTDPLEHISKPLGSGNTKVDGSSASGGLFDAFDGLTKSVPSFSSNMNNNRKEKSPLKAGQNMNSSHTTAGKQTTEKSATKNSENSIHKKKVSVDNYRESHQTLFDMPVGSSDSHKSVGASGFRPSDVNTYSAKTNSQVDASLKSEGNFETGDIWLFVSEIPLFTQPTTSPPPSKPPPPLVIKPVAVSKADKGSTGINSRRKASESSSFPHSTQNYQFHKPVNDSVKSTGISSIDELEDFAMGRSKNFANEPTDILSSEKERETNSAAAASAAAMKEAMDRAEAKFKHAREVRERERDAKAARSREPAWQEVDEKAMKDAQGREQREKQEEKEREEKEKEQRRLEKARERQREIEREKARQAVERATKEARDRAAADARLRAERAAVEKANAEARRRAERAAAVARERQQKSENDLESFFGMGSRPNSAPKQRATPSNKESFEGARRTSAGTSPSIRKASSTTNIVDDLTSIFGAAPSGEFEEVEGETEERRRARLVRHQRTHERAAKALAEKNERDFQTQREQAERHRIAETLDVEIKRWSTGKESNLRALLSTLQYVLWPECGWQPVSLTDLITTASVKKVYRKATLCIHPDKVQQKGANLQQKYIAEKVFDLLKEAWNKLNSEELF